MTATYGPDHPRYESAQRFAKTGEILQGGRRQFARPQHPDPCHLVRRLYVRRAQFGDGETQEGEGAGDKESLHSAAFCGAVG